MTEADGDGKEDENLRVGKSADDLDDDDGRLRNSLLSVSHALYDVSGTGLVPDLRYSGVRATKCGSHMRLERQFHAIYHTSTVHTITEGYFTAVARNFPYAPRCWAMGMRNF